MSAVEEAPTRDRVVTAAIALLELAGPDGVQVRKVAAEIGMSTMAVYTHFGGVRELLEALAREGLSRVTTYVNAVSETDDAVADFFVQGLAVREWALKNPELYRLIFGLSGFAGGRTRLGDLSSTIVQTPEGRAAFGIMSATLNRAKALGQIGDVDTTLAAGQFLSATHGFVLLEMAGYFEPNVNAAAFVLAPMGMNLMIGMGASRASVDRSGLSALARLGIT